MLSLQLCIASQQNSIVKYESEKMNFDKANKENVDYIMNELRKKYLKEKQF